MENPERQNTLWVSVSGILANIGEGDGINPGMDSHQVELSHRNCAATMQQPE
jgi:hypothetical protein